MNKIVIIISEKETSNIISEKTFYFAHKDQTIIQIDSQLRTFEKMYGKIIGGVDLDREHIYKYSATHEIVINVKWGKQ
jgi:hypothetical protein